MHSSLCKFFLLLWNTTNLYLGLVLPSGGWQSPIVWNFQSMLFHYISRAKRDRIPFNYHFLESYMYRILDNIYTGSMTTDMFDSYRYFSRKMGFKSWGLHPSNSVLFHLAPLCCFHGTSITNASIIVLTDRAIFSDRWLLWMAKIHLWTFCDILLKQ